MQRGPLQQIRERNSQTALYTKTARGIFFDGCNGSGAPELPLDLACSKVLGKPTINYIPRASSFSRNVKETGVGEIDEKII